MAAEIKFNFKDLIDLDNDLVASKRAIPVIVQRSLTLDLRTLRNQLRPFIPRATGALQRSFNSSVRRRQGLVTGRIGFLLNRRVSANTAIAANVLQAGGAQARKGKYLWIPIGVNRAAGGAAIMTPRQLIDAGGFVATSGAGNTIAFQRSGNGIIPAFVLKRSIKLSRPPVPIEQRTEAALPEITGNIEETIKQVIEAKRAAQGVIDRGG